MTICLINPGDDMSSLDIDAFIAYFLQGKKFRQE